MNKQHGTICYWHYTLKFELAEYYLSAQMNICQTEFSQSESTSSVLILAPEIKRKEYALNKDGIFHEGKWHPKEDFGCKSKRKTPKRKTKTEMGARDYERCCTEGTWEEFEEMWTDRNRRRSSDAVIQVEKSEEKGGGEKVGVYIVQEGHGRTLTELSPVDSNWS
jgi:hypothetical protein